MNTKSNQRTRRKSNPPAFDVEAFLNSSGVARVMKEFTKKETLFSQGDPSTNIMYIRQRQGEDLPVVSKSGKEAVVAMRWGQVTLSGKGDWQGNQNEWQRLLPLRL